MCRCISERRIPKTCCVAILIYVEVKIGLTFFLKETLYSSDSESSMTYGFYCLGVNKGLQW